LFDASGLEFGSGAHLLCLIWSDSINNLRQYDAAMQQYALENSLASSAPYVMANLTNYVKLTSAGTLPLCPAQGTYQQGANVTVSPTCTLSGGTTGHNLP
jgi:hypothetical protein